MTKAHSAKQYDLLKQHYRQLEKYGQAGYRELQNGRFRYYGKISPANKFGEMAGRRLVREWEPRTGTTRTWHETVDRSSRVRIVRPQGSGNVKIHYQFDNSGNYKGKF